MPEPGRPTQIAARPPSQTALIPPAPLPDRIRRAALALRGREDATPDLLRLFQDQERFLRERFPSGDPTGDGAAEFDAELELRRRWMSHLIRSEALDRYLAIGWKLAGLVLVAGYLTNNVQL